MDDISVQGALWAILALVALAAVVLGHWPRMAGSYQEDGRAMTLGHLGPLMWGHCDLPDGEERYLGLTLGGRVMLRRYDYGARLLAGRGFPKDQLPSLEGICTGFFRLNRSSEMALEGHFCGRRFSVQEGRLVPVETLAPVPRHWQRQG